MISSEEIFKEAVEHLHPVGQNHQEIVPALDLLREHLQTGNFLEIGTQFGSTFYMLSKIYPNKKISVDLSNGIHGGISLDIMMRRNEFLQSKFDNLYMITGNSQEQSSIDAVQNVLGGEQLDLLFIDGDHTYEGVKKDYLNYKQFVRPGGLILFHDIVNRPENVVEQVGVPLFWSELEGQKIEFVCNCSWTHHTPVIGGLGVLIV